MDSKQLKIDIIMKKYYFLLMSLLLLPAMISCNNDDDDYIIGDTPPEIEGLVIDGEELTDVSLYCLVKGDTCTAPWFNYYPKVKTVKDYSSIRFNVWIHRGGRTYSSSSYQRTQDIRQLEIAYDKQKSAFILEDYKDYNRKYAPTSIASWPAYYMACFNGEVTLTCDKILFGEAPGTNLSKYFTIIAESECMPVGLENPTLRYRFGDTLPTIMADLLVDGSWVQVKYFLEFAEQPTEKYDELTLTLTTPMTLERVGAYVKAQYDGKELDSLYTSVAFKSDCLIKFDWE
jgi:hypothetical protein